MGVGLAGEPPPLPPDLVQYLEAFDALSGSRQTGFAAGPIPFEAVDLYAARYGIADEEFEDLAWMVRELDTEFLAHVNKKPSRGDVR